MGILLIMEPEASQTKAIFRASPLEPKMGPLTPSAAAGDSTGQFPAAFTAANAVALLSRSDSVSLAAELSAGAATWMHS